MSGNATSRSDETKRFFFQAVQHGWAGGHAGGSLTTNTGSPDVADWKEFLYENQDAFPKYVFVERWGTDPDSGGSFAHIFIFHWSIPVWGMWLSGTYNKDVHAFLREILMASYRKGLFCGGRGEPDSFRAKLLYTNRYVGDFSRFGGTEYIEYVRAHGVKEPAGSHRYWGGSFVYQPKPGS